MARKRVVKKKIVKKKKRSTRVRKRAPARRSRVAKRKTGARVRRKSRVQPRAIRYAEVEEEEFELTATTKGWTPRRRE